MGSCSWTSRKVRASDALPPSLGAAEAAFLPPASLAPSSRSWLMSFRLRLRPVPVCFFKSFVVTHHVSRTKETQAASDSLMPSKAAICSASV